MSKSAKRPLDLVEYGDVETLRVAFDSLKRDAWNALEATSIGEVYFRYCFSDDYDFTRFIETVARDHGSESRVLHSCTGPNLIIAVDFDRMREERNNR